MWLHILYGTISQKRLFFLWLWTKSNGNTPGWSGFVLNVVSEPCSAEFMCPSCWACCRAGKGNQLLPHQNSASYKTRLHRQITFQWEIKNPFLLETYNCTRLLAVKKHTHHPQPCRLNSRIYCCLMYHNFYFYSKAAVMCMKSKPPSTLLRQSCRCDPRLVPTELLPSFPPPTLYSSQNIYFSSDCLKH